MTDCLQGNVFVSPHADLNLSLLERELSWGHYALKFLSENHADKTILVDVESGRRWSGRQLHDRILNVAAGLVDLLHFRPGSAACISFDHSDSSCILALGIICAGGIVTCVYPTDPYPELLHLSKKTDTKFLFCHRNRVPSAARLAQDLGHEVTGVVMGEEEKEEKEMHVNRLFEYDHTKSPSRSQLPVPCRDLKRDVALILRTSGTTGPPKAVPATHWTCLVTCQHPTLSFDGRGGSTKVACAQSLNYVSGRVILFSGIVAGNTTFIIKTFEPASFCKAIEVHKINVILLGAANFYNFISFPELDKFDLSSMSLVFPMGAKIIYLDQLREFFNKFPNIKLARQSYGTSEFSGATDNFMEPEVYLKDPGNCGRLRASFKAKLLERGSGRLLGPNEVGLLHIKTPGVFSGYYDISLTNGDPNSSPFITNSSVFDEEGYYKTGDLAYFNDRCQLFILGRQFEVIDFFGVNVLPEDLEEVAYRHPAVEKVCVVGVPHKLTPTASCPRAFIEPKRSFYTGKKFTQMLPAEDSPVKEDRPLEHRGEHTLCSMETGRRRQLAESIMQFVNSRVSFPKRLRAGVVLLDEIPITGSSGKFNKPHLRSLTLEQVEIYGDAALM